MYIDICNAETQAIFKRDKTLMTTQDIQKELKEKKIINNKLKADVFQNESIIKDLELALKTRPKLENWSVTVEVQNIEFVVPAEHEANAQDLVTDMMENQDFNLEWKFKGARKHYE